VPCSLRLHRLDGRCALEQRLRERDLRRRRLHVECGVVAALRVDLPARLRVLDARAAEPQGGRVEPAARGQHGPAAGRRRFPVHGTGQRFLAGRCRPEAPQRRELLQRRRREHELPLVAGAARGAEASVDVDAVAAGVDLQRRRRGAFGVAQRRLARQGHAGEHAVGDGELRVSAQRGETVGGASPPRRPGPRGRSRLSR
jgi:hypothetical protein